MNAVLNNYLYISDEKVDLYFNQIKESVLKSISAQIGINFGFVKASIKKPGGDSEGITLVQKLGIVRKFIYRKYDVGTFKSPGDWICEELPAKHVRINENKNIFMLISRLDDRYHLVAGSKKNICGNKGAESVNVGYSYFPYIAEALEHEVSEDTQKMREDHLAAFGEDSTFSGVEKDEIANVIKSLYENSKSLEFQVEILTPKPFVEPVTTTGEKCSISSPLCVSYK